MAKLLEFITKYLDIYIYIYIYIYIPQSYKGRHTRLVGKLEKNSLNFHRLFSSRGATLEFHDLWNVQRGCYELLGGRIVMDEGVKQVGEEI